MKKTIHTSFTTCVRYQIRTIFISSTFANFCKTLKEIFITRPCALKYSRKVLCLPIRNEPNPPLANKGGSNRGEESVNHGSVQLLYQQYLKMKVRRYLASFKNNLVNMIPK